MTIPLPPEYFARQDDRADDLFYGIPRKVVHIDAAAIAAVATLFSEYLPAKGVYLDLMSSWRSHLPTGLHPQQVIGLGLNAGEMADNPQLTDYIVHNLNLTARLPFENEQFDGAMCTVSVQYLTKPIAVFSEVCRVLKPGCPFVVSFSNRCFPTKAVAVWRGSNDEQHLQLVADYFSWSGGWSPVEIRHNPSMVEAGGVTDPLYALIAHKQQESYSTEETFE